MSQPRITAGSITVRIPEIPKSVALIPAGYSLPFVYRDSEVTISVPQIECHAVASILF